MTNYKIKSFLLIFEHMQRDVFRDPRAERLGEIPYVVRQFRRLGTYLEELCEANK